MPYINMPYIKINPNIPKDKYHCECCNYNTNIIDNFIFHINSTIHINKATSAP